MGRTVFFRLSPAGRLERSRWWGAVTGGATLLAVAVLVRGYLAGRWIELLAAASWVLVGGQLALRWFLARRPVVEVDEEVLSWRPGLRERRFFLRDLALSPDPFDVTVIRLQTRQGVMIRIPRDTVARSAELEMLLRRLGEGGGASPSGMQDGGGPAES